MRWPAKQKDPNLSLRQMPQQTHQTSQAAFSVAPQLQSPIFFEMINEIVTPKTMSRIEDEFESWNDPYQLENVLKKVLAINIESLAKIISTRLAYIGSIYALKSNQIPKELDSNMEIISKYAFGDI